MNLETTVKKIEETLELLEMFNSKRKPLVKRKIVFKDSMKTTIHILIGHDEIGRYTLDKGEKDIYFKDWDTLNLPTNDTHNCFFMEVRGRELDFKVLNITKHLTHLNKFKGMSKPSKKDLDKLKYSNESNNERGASKWSGKEFPNKEDLMNQKVYLHVRDTCTNSMLMSQDFDILPKNLNQLINEVISMNPHLVRDLNIDFYMQEGESNLPTRRLQLQPSSKEGARQSQLGLSREVTEYTTPTQYFTIKEALYVSIVNNMSKSKDLMVSYKRESITNQYIEAFINIKNNLGDAGFSASDIEKLVKKREGGTQRIKLVMGKILIEHPRSFHRHKSILFNHINHKLDMHAIKKDRDNNRTIKSGNLQISIAWLEQMVHDILTECLDSKVSPMLAVGVASLYIKELNLMRKEPVPPKVWLKALVESKDSVSKIETAINTNPYKAMPLERQIKNIIQL